MSDRSPTAAVVDPSPLPADRGLLYRWLHLLPFALVAATLGMLGLALWSSWNSHIESAEVTTRNLIRVIEEQTARSLEVVDARLEGSASLWAQRPPATPSERDEFRGYLRKRLLTLSHVNSVQLVDAQGRLLLDAAGNERTRTASLADAAWFMAHRRQAVGLYVGRPVRDASGFWQIPASRPIVSITGQLTGVIVVMLSPEFFEDAYDGLDVGRRGVVNLRHVEGDLVARKPPLPESIGRHIPTTAALHALIRQEGTATTIVTSSLDGERRITSAREVEGVPLIVVVGLSETDVLIPWRREVFAYVTLAVGLGLLAAQLAVRLRRALRGRDRLLASLSGRERLLRQVLDSLPVGVFVADAKGRLDMVNQAAQRIWGGVRYVDAARLAEYRGTRPDTGEPLGSRDWPLARALNDGISITDEVIDIEGFDGSRKTISSYAAPMWDEQGQPRGGIAVIEDITEKRALLGALTAAEARYGALFENSIDAVLIYDTEGRIRAANPEACQLLGYERDALLATPREAILDPRSPPIATLLENLALAGRARGEVELLHRDGIRIPAEISATLFREKTGDILVSLIARDITERRLAEARIQHLAYHDELTGLANRGLFNETLRRALSQGTRTGRPFALLTIDLDGFKAINDVLGHDTGDAVLREVAARLRHCVRESDLAARLGGDEFMLLLEGIGNGPDVARIAEKVLDEVARPYVIVGRQLRVTASVGVSLYPRDGRDAGSLIKHGDLAMYQAKRDGKNRWQDSIVPIPPR